MAPPSPKLTSPPINEVICGFIFDPTALDMLEFGVYAEQRRESYPHREILPPVFDPGPDQLSIKFELNPVSFRARLKNLAGDRLIQLQSDRLYVNWLRGKETYPRFSSHDGVSGLKASSLEEFATLARFIEGRTGAAPALKRLELTKVDLLEQGRDYRSTEDLSELLRVVQVFNDVSVAERLQLRLDLREVVDGSMLDVSINVGPDSARIETRNTFPIGPSLDEAFDAANARVNRVFFGLVDTDKLLGESR